MDFGKTPPSLLAAQKGNEKTVKSLEMVTRGQWEYNRGASTSTQIRANYGSRMPESYAKEKGHIRVIELKQ